MCQYFRFLCIFSSFTSTRAYLQHGKWIAQLNNSVLLEWNGTSDDMLFDKLQYML